MPAPAYLRPEECMDVLARRVRRRIQTLRDARLDGYAVAIGELEVFLKQLENARRYIANVSSKLETRPPNSVE